MLEEKPRNLETIKSEFTIYLERVEVLYSASEEEHSEWLAPHKKTIDKFRERLESVIHPTPKHPRSRKSVSTGSSYSSTTRLRLKEEKARLAAKREVASKAAELQKKEIRLKALHEENLLNLKLQKENLEAEKRK